MARYRINDEVFCQDDAAPGASQMLGAALVTAYAGKLRPVCLCTARGVPMYIAKVGGSFLIKRMPDTGPDHAPGCESYEPPPELSGLGQLAGTAIQENTEAGVTELRLGFALTKIAGRSAPVPSGSGDATSAKADSGKLTLRATLHYLWDQAGFSRWSPAMAGRRNWAVVRRHLLQAADHKVTKGTSLSRRLYIPEVFSADDRLGIARRRQAVLANASPAAAGSRPLLIVIAEVKEIAPARFGHKIVFKHLPDFSFPIGEDFHKRIERVFAAELELWRVHEQSHLVGIATFGMQASGVPLVEEVALMNVTEHWLPYENAYEHELLQALAQSNRRFVKGMRYNLPKGRPLASAVTTDSDQQPTAMYVIPPEADDEYGAALQELIATSRMQPWTWKAGVDAMPGLPRR